MRTYVIGFIIFMALYVVWGIASILYDHFQTKKTIKKPQEPVPVNDKEEPEPPSVDSTFGGARVAWIKELQRANLITPHDYTGPHPGGIYIGAPIDQNMDYRRDRIRYKGDAHLITVAPSRSGKGRDILVPALMDYQESVLVIDPKGQLAAITARRRREMGHKVFILNPFNILPNNLGPSAGFNPMGHLNPSSEGFGADCDNLADAIVWHTGGDVHWSDSARLLVSGIIMALAEGKNEERKNLATLRELITGPRVALKAFCRDAQKGNPITAQKLARFCDMKEDDKEVVNIISHALTQTGFMGVQALMDNLSRSDFRFADLKREKVTVYLVLPAAYIGTCAKWFRLVVAAALDELLREEKAKVRVLMILDEFAQLGPLKVIENAMALAAGYGVQLWPILQDLNQLKNLYGKSWETFMANSGVRQFFAPRDLTTSEYLEKLLGQKTIINMSAGSREISVGEKERGFSGITRTANRQQRPLFYAQEIRGWPEGIQILFIEGVLYPVLGWRLAYWKWEALQGLYDPDPYHDQAGTA